MVLTRLKGLVAGLLATKEAVLTWTIVSVVAVLVYKVVVAHEPVADVLSADSINYVFTLAAAFIARMMVWSKSSYDNDVGNKFHHDRSDLEG